jgi:uncharacterized phage infection (PIP) family protein YhgE|tara:strand:+ start:6476 stop:7366 length:891 start_codon:yes stop_codon:yes gene_type:complete
MNDASGLNAGADAALPTESEPFEVPEQIDDSTFEDLFGDDQPTDATSQGEEPTQSAPQPAPEPDLGPVDHPPQQPMQNPQAMIQQTVAATVQGLQQGQNQQQAVKTGLDRLKAANPNMSDDELKWMAGAVDTVVSSSPLAAQMHQLQSRLNQVEQTNQRGAQEKVAGNYDHHLDALLDKAQVTDPFERKAMKAVVTQDGLQEYGQQFSHEAATRVFRNVNNTRRQEAHTQRQQYVSNKTAQQDNSPPFTHSNSTSSASENIMAGLKDPKNKSWGFRGQDFQKAVRWLEQKSNDTLG